MLHTDATLVQILDNAKAALRCKASPESRSSSASILEKLLPETAFDVFPVMTAVAIKKPMDMARAKASLVKEFGKLPGRIAWCAIAGELMSAVPQATLPELLRSRPDYSAQQEHGDNTL